MTDMYFFILKGEQLFSFEIKSTLNISKSKFITDNLYFKVSFLIPIIYFEIPTV